MPFVIRPDGDTDLANATLHDETALPQTVTGLSAGAYQVGRLVWSPDPVTVTGAAAPGPVLLIVAGQSNARTAGNSAGLADPKYAALGDVVVFQLGSGADIAAQIGAGTLDPYDIGSNADPDNTGTAWGSEAEFIYQMRQAGDDRRVVVVKEAQNGRSLAVDWSPDITTGKFVNLEAKVARVRALEATPFDEEVTLWNQGEADAGDANMAAAYAANWTFFLQQFRSRISTGFLVAERIRPLGYSALGGLDDPEGYARAWAVREAVVSGVAADGNAAAIDLDFDLTTFGTIHPVEPWTRNKALRGHAAYAGTYDATYGSLLDAVPDAIGFADLNDVTPGETVTSGAQLVTGIERQTAVSVSGGEFRTLNSLDGDAVVSDWASAGVADKFQKVQLRQTASAVADTARTATLIMGGVSSPWTIRTFASAPSYEPETTAFIAQVASNGGGAIGGADATALDTFYIAAKAASWWPKLLRLHLRLADEPSSRLDLVGQSHSLTNTGVSSSFWTWAAATGWTGLDNANGGLDFGIDPSVQMPQNDASYGLWYASLPTSNRADLSGDQGSCYFRATQAGAARYLLHSGANTNASGLTVATGLRAVVRDGATSLRLHGPDGSVLHSSAVASTAPTDTVLDIGNREGAYSDASILGGFVAGAALSEAELQDFAAAAGALQDHFAA